jgi:hypothetical protein
VTESSASYRVKVRRKYIPFYKDLLRRKIFQQHSEFFTLCCCVGKNLNSKEGDFSADDLFQAYTFTDYQRTVLRCLVYQQTGKILEEKELFIHAEKMADLGCQLLIETVLNEVVFVDQDGSISLKPGQETELQLKLSKYVNNRLTDVPF